MRGLLYKMLLWLVLCAGLWAGGLLWFASQIPTLPASDISADAIVVLTGGSGRLEYGLELLAGGHGKEIFISGVSKGVTRQDIVRQSSAATQKILAKGGNDTIFLGDDAVNTIGNAEETKRWLSKRGTRSLALVTSNYHMPRSLSEFHEALPGLQIIPAPVFSDDVSMQRWLTDDASRHIILSEYHKYLASKLRHWFVSATHRA